MQKFRYVLSPKARRDIEGIFEYIVKQLISPDAAFKLVDKFFIDYERLENFLFTGRELENCYNLKFTYRWIITDKYISFYTVDANNFEIKIMRVLYAHSNYLKYLE